MLCRKSQSTIRLRNALLANCEPRSEWTTKPENGSSSSFGEANVFGSGAFTQDLSALRVQTSIILGDVNQDGVVNFLGTAPFHY